MLGFFFAHKESPVKSRTHAEHARAHRRVFINKKKRWRGVGEAAVVVGRVTDRRPLDMVRPHPA